MHLTAVSYIHTYVLTNNYNIYCKPNEICSEAGLTFDHLLYNSSRTFTNCSCVDQSVAMCVRSISQTVERQVVIFMYQQVRLTDVVDGLI